MSRCGHSSQNGQMRSAPPRALREQHAGPEAEADRLLAASVSKSGRGQYPFYTQRRMERLSARELQWHEGLQAAAGLGGDCPREPGVLARLVVDAQLTRRQRLVVRCLAQGLSQARIAEMLGVSEATVSRLKRSALEQMRRAAER